MKIRSTTILGVRVGGKTTIGGDGQVTVGETVIKHNATKIRTLADGKILAGFAGSTADALTLFEKFEAKLETYGGSLRRAAVELAKDWRSDRVLRRLEALLAVMDNDHSFVLSGTGDIIEPDDEIIALGSGAPYALAAARAFLRSGREDAEGVVRDALGIAAEICLYTNTHVTTKTL